MPESQSNPSQMHMFRVFFRVQWATIRVVTIVCSYWKTKFLIWKIPGPWLFLSDYRISGKCGMIHPVSITFGAGCYKQIMRFTDLLKYSAQNRQNAGWSTLVLNGTNINDKNETNMNKVWKSNGKFCSCFLKFLFQNTTNLSTCTVYPRLFATLLFATLTLRQEVSKSHFKYFLLFSF